MITPWMKMQCVDGLRQAMLLLGVFWRGIKMTGTHTHTQIPTPLPLHDHYFMGLLRATSPASRTYLHSLNIVFEQEVTGRGIERNINL
jgi:hypothetical protein